MTFLECELKPFMNVLNSAIKTFYIQQFIPFSLDWFVPSHFEVFKEKVKNIVRCALNVVFGKNKVVFPLPTMPSRILFSSTNEIWATFASMGMHPYIIP